MSPQPKKSGGFSLDDYVDVAERIQNFKDAHPDGSLQTLSWGVQEVAGKPFVYYQAAAYRTAGDERPGVGIAWEPFPGPTSYTKDSELMNAETAAWGRSIVALGLVANRKLASRQEVRARTQEPDAKAAAETAKAAPKWQATEAQRKELRELYGKAGWTSDGDHERLRMLLASVGAGNAGTVAECLARLTEDQFAQVREALFVAATAETFDATEEKV